MIKINKRKNLEGEGEEDEMDERIEQIVKLAPEITGRNISVKDFMEERIFGKLEECIGKKLPALNFYFENKCDVSKCEEEYKSYQKDIPKESLDECAKFTTKKQSEIVPILRKWGVAILNGVLTPFETDILFERSLLDMVAIYPDLEDLENWDSKKTPCRNRLGMYQSIVSQSSVAWFLREKVSSIFKEIWGVKKVGTSQDGAFILPPGRGQDNLNWLHIDGLSNDCELNGVSIQGETILTNSGAAFLACVGEGAKHVEMLKETGIAMGNAKKKVEQHNRQVRKSGKGRLWGEDELNKKGEILPDYWHFSDEECEVVERVYGKENYKRACYAEKGSMIFWYSTTPHQAQRQSDAPFWNKQKSSGKLFERIENLENWRCIFYQTQLPEKFYSTDRKKKMLQTYKDGTSSNHLAKPFPRFAKYDKMKAKRVVEVYHNTSEYQTPITEGMRNLINFK